MATKWRQRYVQIIELSPHPMTIGFIPSANILQGDDVQFNKIFSRQSFKTLRMKKMMSLMPSASSPSNSAQSYAEILLESSIKVLSLSNISSLKYIEQNLLEHRSTLARSCEPDPFSGHEIPDHVCQDKRQKEPQHSD